MMKFTVNNNEASAATSPLMTIRIKTTKLSLILAIKSYLLSPPFFYDDSAK